MKLLILGVNGFIGNQLVKKILQETDWEIYGLDIKCDKLQHSIYNKRFRFKLGDVGDSFEWIKNHVKKCDIILPLVAISLPGMYVIDPIKVFEATFELNLPIVRMCVEYNKRLVFPSTSEVYGCSDDEEYFEDFTKLTQGPINKERWIYSCSKQLMDRIIFAYGKRDSLKYTLFRPFNWVGPTQDQITNFADCKIRVLPQFVSNVYYGSNLNVVDGGNQRRCFTYIEDGIDALIKILVDNDNVVDKEIINIGNPENDISILELANKILKCASNLKYRKYHSKISKIKIQIVSGEEYYGINYQDTIKRIPSIDKARRLLKWEPKVGIDEIIERTLDYYLV